MLDKAFTAFTGRVSELAGKPVAFITMLGFTLLWAMTGPYFQFSDTWQLVINTSTTIITCLLGFLLLNQSNRSELAIQIKLDEIAMLCAGSKDAVGIEHLTIAELEVLREKIEAEVKK